MPQNNKSQSSSQCVLTGEVTTHKRLQVRVVLNAETIEDYKQLLDDNDFDFPPVIVFGHENWLADGYHRLEAYKQAGRKRIPVRVKDGGFQEAFLYSLTANRAHGLRLTNADKRNGVINCFQNKNMKNWSKREIANACGVTTQFVGKMKQEYLNKCTNAPANSLPGSRERGSPLAQQSSSNPDRKKLTIELRRLLNDVIMEDDKAELVYRIIRQLEQ